MKKHRNFLIFYSLWLGGIFMIFTVFGTTQDKNMAPINEGDPICELTKKSTRSSEQGERDKKLCGVLNHADYSSKPN